MGFRFEPNTRGEFRACRADNRCARGRSRRTCCGHECNCVSVRRASLCDANVCGMRRNRIVAAVSRAVTAAGSDGPLSSELIIAAATCPTHRTCINCVEADRPWGARGSKKARPLVGLLAFGPHQVRFASSANRSRSTFKFSIPSRPRMATTRWYQARLSASKNASGGGGK